MGGRTSAASKNKYAAKAYDRIALMVPKGQKDIIKKHAESHDESVNAFLQRAVAETMQRDTNK